MEIFEEHPLVTQGCADLLLCPDTAKYSDKPKTSSSLNDANPCIADTTQNRHESVETDPEGLQGYRLENGNISHLSEPPQGEIK